MGSFIAGVLVFALFNWAGSPWWGLGAGLLTAVFAWLHDLKPPKPAARPARAAGARGTRKAEPAGAGGDDAGAFDPGLMFNVPELMRRGRWEEARRAMQKLAYSVVREPQHVRDEFKALMTRFAAEDPLVSAALRAVQPVVASKPGVKQTELYAHMPGLSVEEARYVLYFAHELGAVVRRKKGNSYQVFPAGWEAPPELAAPKKRPARSRATDQGAGVP